MGTGFPRHDGVFRQPPPRPTTSSSNPLLFSLTACSFVSPGTPGAHGGVVAAVRAYFRPVRSRGNPRPPLRPTMGTGFPRHDGVFPPTPSSSNPLLFSLTACSFVSPGTPGAHGGVVAAVRAYFRPVRSRGNPAHLCAPPWVPGFPGTTRKGGTGRPVRDYISASAPVVFSHLNHSGRDEPARHARMEQAS